MSLEDSQETEASETYFIDKMEFLVPSENDIEYLLMETSTKFDTPEGLLSSWITEYFMRGPQLIEPAIEHLKTLTDEDMPENYIEDLIKEFWERIETELFKIKNKRFKLIKSNDAVTQSFSRELSIRNESYKTAENVLTNLGYKEQEITPALKKAINSISDLDDTQQILSKALNILSGVLEDK